MLFAALTLAMPLLAGALIALLGSALGERCARIGIWALAVSAGAALLALAQTMLHDPVLQSLPAIPAAWAPALFVDRLAAVMMVLITGVSLVIHAYSQRYMHDDPGYARFFSLLSLLTFALLTLVTGGNLLWMGVSWHLITWILTSLLAFNRENPEAHRAGRRPGIPSPRRTTHWVRVMPGRWRWMR